MQIAVAVAIGDELLAQRGGLSKVEEMPLARVPIDGKTKEAKTRTSPWSHSGRGIGAIVAVESR